MKVRDSIVNIYYNSPYIVRYSLGNIYGLMLYKKRFGNDFWKYYEWLLKSQYWNYDELMDYQIKKLRALFKEAYSNVPFYRQLLKDSGIDPTKVDHEILKKMPILTKKDIRENIDAMINVKSKRKRYMKWHSSGTTGEKLAFFIPKTLYHAFNSALRWRAYSWAGVKPGDKRISIGGRILSNKPPYWLYNKYEKQLYLSIHHIGKCQEITKAYLNEFISFQPDFLQGHPSGVFELAKAFREQGKVIKANIKAIFTTGETLFDDQRKTIEDVFGAKVFESYGLGESVVAAFECEKHNGFHEASELGIIQFEKGKDGNIEVIGTCLENRVMPFIRYRIEDIVIESDVSCSCGKSLPIKIKEIIGRIDDTLTRADETPVLPVTIRMAIKPILDDFQNYQLVQIGKNNLLFKWFGSDLSTNQEQSIRKTLKGIFSDDLRIEFEKSDTLTTKGGKIRNVINNYNK